MKKHEPEDVDMFYFYDAFGRVTVIGEIVAYAISTGGGQITLKKGRVKRILRTKFTYERMLPRYRFEVHVERLGSGSPGVSKLSHPKRIVTLRP